MEEIKWKMPRVGELLATLQQINGALQLLQVGEVWRRDNAGRSYAWRSDLEAIRAALMNARTEIEHAIVRQARRRSPDR